MNIATRFSWHRFCIFFCCIGGLFPAMLLLLFTCPGDSSSLWKTLWGIPDIPDRAFPLSDLRGLSAPKIPCRGPWSCWPAQEWGTVKCVLGEETAWLSRKQTQESPCNLFIGRSKGNLLCSSKQTSPLAWVESFKNLARSGSISPSSLDFCALYSCLLNICQHVSTTYCSSCRLMIFAWLLPL